MENGAGDGFLHAVSTSRVYDVARETPLDPAPRLSRRLGSTVLLKREDLQPVFSFKLRGAYNKIAHLDAEERARGVITASAGNHAQGVALSARQLGHPRGDRDAADDARDQGGRGARPGRRGRARRRLLLGRARRTADALAAETGLVFVHPFDDPLVIAGQGTIGEEILRQSHGRVSAVFVPVGGGGLLAGVAGYVKALVPAVRVFGVEPFEADAMYRSLAAGRRVRLDHVGIFADGVAVREVGALTFAMRPGDGRRGRARHQRRDLRRDQGRVRRDAQRDGAGGRPRGGRAEGVGGARARRSSEALRAPAVLLAAPT